MLIHAYIHTYILYHTRVEIGLLWNLQTLGIMVYMALCVCVCVCVLGSELETVFEDGCCSHLPIDSGHGKRIVEVVYQAGIFDTIGGCGLT